MGIWHSGLYKGMNKDIFVLFFCTCVQQCSGAVFLTFVAERIVPVSDCSWICSIKRSLRGIYIFWTEKCAKWCTLTAKKKKKPAGHKLQAYVVFWMLPCLVSLPGFLASISSKGLCCWWTSPYGSPYHSDVEIGFHTAWSMPK